MDKDQLLSFVNVVGKEFPFTNRYAFKALLSEETGFYNVKFYSGFLRQVLNFLNHKSIKPSVTSSREKYVCKNLEVSKVLRPHQKRIVTNCLSKKRGIVKSPTGSGKSFVIAELVRKFKEDNLKVLITVPTISLLHQMTNDINNYMQLAKEPAIEIGKVGDGNYDFKDITIGIPNSLCKLDKTKDYLNTVDVLLADEVHTTANPTYASIVHELTNRAVSVGLSATPWTSDGSNILLDAFFGRQIVEITEAEMINKGIIMEPLFEFYAAPKAFVPNSISAHASNISNLSDAHRYKTLASVYNYVIINNKARNTMVVNKAVERVKLDCGPVLIIVNKVKGQHSHADILTEMLETRGLSLPTISGYISKKKKEGLINDLKECNIPGAIAGPKVLSAGISINSLSTIILAGAGRSDSEFIQRVGRLLRKEEGKERPLVIDFQDPQFWFASQSRSRIKTAEEIYGSDNIIIK